MKNVILMVSILLLLAETSAQQIDTERLIDSIISSSTNDTLRAEALANLAKTYIYSAPKEAVTLGEAALQQAEVSEKKDLIASIALNLGTAYYHTGNFDNSILKYKQAKEIFVTYRDSTQVLNANMGIGNIAFVRGDFEKAKTIFEESLMISKQSGKVKMEANFSLNLASLYSVKSNFKKAIDFLENAKRVYLNTKDSTSLAVCLMNLGIMNQQIGKYDIASTYYFESLDLNTEQKNVGGESDCLTNIGNLFFLTEDYPKAIEYLEKAIITKTNIGAENTLGNSYTNLGISYAKLDKPEKSKAILLKGIDLFAKTDNEYGKANAQVQLGMLYQNELHQHKKAKELITESLPVIRSKGDKVIIASALAVLGDANQDLGNNKESLQDYSSSVDIARSIGNLNTLHKGLNKLSKNYALLGRYKEAYETQKEYNEVSDSLLTIEKVEVLNDLEQKYASAKLKSEKQELELINVEKEKENIVLRQEKSLFVLVLLFILLLGTIYYMHNRHTRKLNRIISNLLYDVRHRVGSDLTSIYNTTYKESLPFSPDKQRPFQKILSKINAFQNLYGILYTRKNLEWVNMPNFIQEVSSTIVKAYGYDNSIIMFNIQNKVDFKIRYEQAKILASVMTEIFSNAFQHAFTSEQLPQFNVALRQEDENFFLQIKDNGKGMDVNESRKSGMQLIDEIIYEDMEGQLNKYNDNGLVYEIRAKLAKKRSYADQNTHS